MNQSALRCICGRRFLDAGGYRRHQTACKQSKTSITSAAERFRAATREKKRREAIAREEEALPITTDDRDALDGSDQVEEAQEETFLDVLPRIPGLQSAVTGRVRRQTEKETEKYLENVPLGAQPKRSAAARRLPGRFRDTIPEGPSPLQQTPSPAIVEGATTTPIATSPTPSDKQQQHGAVGWRTMPNSFGVLREYLKRPLHIPDVGVQVDGLVFESEDTVPGADASPDTENSNSTACLQAVHNPFPNLSSLMLAHWYHNCGERMSQERLRSLVDEVLGSEHFNITDIKGLNVSKLDTALDKCDAWMPASSNSGGEGNSGGDISGLGGGMLGGGMGDGWIEEAVRIEIPTGVKQLSTPSAAPASKPFSVPGLLRRSLVQVIKAACQESAAQDFHFEPFKSFHTIPSPSASPSPSTVLVSSMMCLGKKYKNEGFHAWGLGLRQVLQSLGAQRVDLAVLVMKFVYRGKRSQCDPRSLPIRGATQSLVEGACPVGKVPLK